MIRPSSSQAIVVSSPSAGAGSRSPAFRSTKLPVPYVFLAIPGWAQPWPKRAACWSPAIPATGISPPNSEVVPKIPADGIGSGRRSGSTPSSPQSSGSQRRSPMSKSIVRDAFERSVAWRPVSLNTSHESTVPKIAPRASSTFRSSHSILVPEKYGSRTRPVRSRTSGSWPASRSSSQRAAVRRSCQTSALWTGSPVDGSQATTVSRWFVIPIASRLAGSALASASACEATRLVTSQISFGSCSTQPGRGKCCRNSL